MASCNPAQSGHFGLQIPLTARHVVILSWDEYRIIGLIQLIQLAPILERFCIRFKLGEIELNQMHDDGYLSDGSLGIELCQNISISHNLIV
jgi:hypothetical protein